MFCGICFWHFSICPGFFVDINLFKGNKERAAEIAKNNNKMEANINGNDAVSAKDGIADEDANLMIKLKFLTYKVCACQEIHLHLYL